MPKTTTTEKTDRINAARAKLNLPALTEEQALVLLKANAMSPKRVIRAMQDAAPKAEPKATTPEAAFAKAAAVLATPKAQAEPPKGKIVRTFKAPKADKPKSTAVKGQPGVNRIPAEPAGSAA